MKKFWGIKICLYLNSKIRLTMLLLSGFELYSRWVPLKPVSCPFQCFSLLGQVSKTHYIFHRKTQLTITKRNSKSLIKQSTTGGNVNEPTRLLGKGGHLLRCCGLPQPLLIIIMIIIYIYIAQTSI